MNVPSGTDALNPGVVGSPYSGGKVNVPLGTDALNPEIVRTTPSGGRVDVPSGTDALNPGETNKFTLPRKSKGQLKRERRRLAAAMAKSLVIEEGGAKGKTAPAVSTDEPPKTVMGTPSCGEESRKRGRTAGDTPELQLKKSKLGSSFSQAVKKGIKLRVTCKDDSKEMTSGDANYIAKMIEERVLEGNICQVERNYLQPDGLYYICKDEKTMTWLRSIINQLAAPTEVEDHPGYLAMGPGDRPPLKRFFVWFPGDREPSKSLKMLQICNPGFDAKRVAIRAVIPGEGGYTLVLGVAAELIGLLEANNFRLYCGVSSVQFKEPKKSNTNPKTERPQLVESHEEVLAVSPLPGPSGTCGRSPLLRDDLPAVASLEMELEDNKSSRTSPRD